MSRAVSSALVALVLASNLVGGICFWCHNDGEAHDEPCCGMDAQADRSPQLGDAGCCEQLSQWRVTQAVERVELGVSSPVVATVVIVEPVGVVLAHEARPLEPPRPGGALLQQHRALLI